MSLNGGRGGGASGNTPALCKDCKVNEIRKGNKTGKCGTCYRNKNANDEHSTERDNATTVNETFNRDSFVSHMGIQWADIEEVPLPNGDWLNKPIAEVTMGQFLKVVTNTISASHENLSNQISGINQELKKNEEERKSLQAENKNINEKLKLQDARVKNLEESCKKMKTVITKQQSLIVQHDRDARSKRLIISGISQQEWELHGQTADTEKDKVKLVLNYLHKGDIDPVYAKRIGNKDQGPQKRPRYLLVEFKDKSDRNEVMTASSELKNDEETKKIRIKADLTKAEREEYSRIYKEKEKLESEDNTATVIFERGKLIVNGTVVDQLKFNSSIFQNTS